MEVLLSAATFSTSIVPSFLDRYLNNGLLLLIWPIEISPLKVSMSRRNWVRFLSLCLYMHAATSLFSVSFSLKCKPQSGTFSIPYSWRNSTFCFLLWWLFRPNLSPLVLRLVLVRSMSVRVDFRVPTLILISMFGSSNVSWDNYLKNSFSDN